MRSLRSILSIVATDPSKLDETAASIHPMILDMDLDSTFVIAYTPQDVHNVAKMMDTTVTDDQAHRVLSILLDTYDPAKGMTIGDMQVVISEVLSTPA